MDSTAVTIVESHEPLHPICREYPGLQLPASASQEDIELVIIAASEYTGAITVSIDDYLTRRHPQTKEEMLIPLQLWGCMAYAKQRVDQVTGEVRNVVGIVFKARLSEQDSYCSFISFESVAANNFFRRSILPLRTLGDWDRPLYMVVRPIPLKTGHTYAFQLVKGE